MTWKQEKMRLESARRKSEQLSTQNVQELKEFSALKLQTLELEAAVKRQEAEAEEWRQEKVELQAAKNRTEQTATVREKEDMERRKEELEIMTRQRESESIQQRTELAALKQQTLELEATSSRQEAEAVAWRQEKVEFVTARQRMEENAKQRDMEGLKLRKEELADLKRELKAQRAASSSSSAASEQAETADLECADVLALKDFLDYAVRIFDLYDADGDMRISLEETIALGLKLGYGVKRSSAAAAKFLKQASECGVKLAGALPRMAMSTASSSVSLSLESFVGWLFSVIVRGVYPTREEVNTLQTVFDPKFLINEPSSVLEHYCRTLYDAFTNEKLLLQFAELVDMARVLGLDKQQAQAHADRLLAAVQASGRGFMTAQHLTAWIGQAGRGRAAEQGLSKAQADQAKLLRLMSKYGPNPVFGVRAYMARK
jgi:hypothetical protein